MPAKSITAVAATKVMNRRSMGSADDSIDRFAGIPTGLGTAPLRIPE